MNNNEYNIKYICRENLHFISHVYKYTAFYNYFTYILPVNNWRDRR